MKYFDLIKKIKLILLFVAVHFCISNCIAQHLSENGVPLIIAKELDNGVILEKLYIEKGKLEIINDPSVITIILPVSEGTACSMIKASDKEGMIMVKNNNNQLEIRFKSIDGKEREYPYHAPLDDLREFEIRANVTKGDGYKQAFIINNYDLIKKDNGPVLDMFGGMIPLQEDYYSFTVETRISLTSKTMIGEVPFKKVDTWVVIEDKLPSGKSGKFIIDTGASGGIVL